MGFFNRVFDPYQWRNVRSKGKGLYFVDNGLLPGFVAGIAYAALMVLMGRTSSPYLNAAIFTLVSTPIYIWMCHRKWEINEDAFAAWVAEEWRLMNARGDQGADSERETH